MNAVLALAEKAAKEPFNFNEVISHLSPHKYSWAPDWGAFTITNAVFNIFLAAGLVMFVFWTAANKPKIVPKGIQNFVEAAIDWLKSQIVYSVMSPADGRVWFPFIATFFFFILFLNVVGVIPVIGFTPTSNIFVTMTLALMVYLTAVTIGVAKHGFVTFWKKTLIPPGIPGWMKGPMFVIEIVSQIARPFSLAVRLFANMLADHLLLLIFVGFIFLAGASVLAVVVIPFSMAFEIVFMAFGLFVAFIQAAIFAFLATLYINDALHPGH